MTSDFPVLVDACVLVQAAVRDTLLRLFERRLFLARWTDEFLVDLYYVNGEMVIHELHQQGASLAKPRSIDEVLTSLEICQCRQFVKLIREKLQ